MGKSTTIFLTVLFCLTSSVVWSETVEVEDLVKREGLYYKKSTSVPFSGKVTGKEQGRIKNGKKEGRWEIYNKNGRVEKEITFRNGKETGSEVRYKYHSNGQLNYKGDYRNDKKEGSWVSYRDNGTVNKKITGTYKNGKKISD